MRVVVTGAAGFIGSHLVPELRHGGYAVSGTVEAGPDSPPPAAGMTPVDIVSGRGLDDALRGADAVVHLAARNHVLDERAPDPLSEYRKVNVDGTRNVARAATRAGARLLVHASSVKAMGEAGGGTLTEESPCRPASPYGVSKLESEEAARAETAGSGTALVVLRLPMVYGPGNKGNLPRMIRWAQSGLPFPLFRPDEPRSILYVENLAAAVLAVLGGPAARNALYLVRDAEDASNGRIYAAICDALGKTPRFVPIPSWMVRLGTSFSRDIGKMAGTQRVSSERFRKTYGVIPPVSFGEGIGRTVIWYTSKGR